MKRIIKILLASLMMLLVANTVSAAGEHVIVNTNPQVISYEQLNELETDLLHIEKDYDISIYIVFDQSISTSDTGLIDYANSFAQRYFTSANNVGLFINSQYYYVMADGSASAKIEENTDSLWDEFFYYASEAESPEDENLFKGIQAFYQKAVALINGEVYHSNVPGVV
ncbi:MAG: hypothetical protein J6S49_07795, partial [Erysipelotrichaceae bacterium]|nr:hypothetical protein [Erysipelotrichaceae bacterium]